MSLIRKLSVGPNYPDGSVHFQLDRPVLYNRDEGRKTHRITNIEEDINPEGIREFSIYVENIPENGEIVSKVKWKTISSNLPHTVEYAIDYE